MNTSKSDAEATRRMVKLGWRIRSVYTLRHCCMLEMRSAKGTPYTVKLYAAELAVTSDFAQSIGHPDAAHLVRALELVS